MLGASGIFRCHACLVDRVWSSATSSSSYKMNKELLASWASLSQNVTAVQSRLTPEVPGNSDSIFQNLGDLKSVVVCDSDCP